MKTICIVLNGVKETSTPHFIPGFSLFVGDGGVRHVSKDMLVQAGEVFFCGDADSASLDEIAHLRSECERQKKLFTQLKKESKNVSDFGFILDRIAKTYRDPLLIHILCGRGGRPDHELINLFEAAKFAKNYMADASCFFGQDICVFKGSVVFANPAFTSFSITALNATRVEIQGAQYSGMVELSRPSQGLSNMVTGKSLTIQSKNDVVFLFTNTAGK